MCKWIILLVITANLLAQDQMPQLDLSPYEASNSIIVEFNRLNDESLNAKVQYYDGKVIIKKPLYQRSGVVANLVSAGWLVVYLENHGWHYEANLELPQKGKTEFERRKTISYLFRRNY